MISFTSFQAYYANIGPAAVEKNSGVDVLFFTYLSNISYGSRNHLLNVMLFFEKFIKSRNEFIHFMLPWSKQKKSYATLKFHQFCQKLSFFISNFDRPIFPAGQYSPCHIHMIKNQETNFSNKFFEGVCICITTVL